MSFIYILGIIIAHFIHYHIICHFSVPSTTITEKGTLFNLE